MDELKEKVSYVVFEGELTRMERTVHRLWISTILLLIALLGTNAGWIWYESTFDYYTENVSQEVQDAEGNNIRLIGGDYYGESETDGN